MDSAFFSSLTHPHDSPPHPLVEVKQKPRKEQEVGFRSWGDSVPSSLQPGANLGAAHVKYGALECSVTGLWAPLC